MNPQEQASIAGHTALLHNSVNFLAGLDTAEQAITKPTHRRVVERTLRATARLLLLAADRFHHTPEASQAIRAIQENCPRTNLN